MRATSLSSIAEALNLPVDRLEYLHRLGLLRDTSSSRRATTSKPAFVLDDVQRAIANLRWLVIVTPPNWQELAAEGLLFARFAERQRRTLELMSLGQQIAFYVTRFSAFVAIANVLGKPVRKNVMWPGGVFPLAVPIEPSLVLEPKGGAKISPLVSKLEFIHAKKHWAMALRRTIVPLCEQDFALIARHLKQQPDGRSRTTGRGSN